MLTAPMKNCSPQIAPRSAGPQGLRTVGPSLLLFDSTSGAKKVLMASPLSLESPLWMPDQKALLVLASGPATNFNRDQIGMVSYPQGVYHSITNDTNDYPTLSLSADGKNRHCAVASCNRAADRVLGCQERRRITGNRQQPSGRHHFRLESRQQISSGAGKRHLPHGCRWQQPRAADPQRLSGLRPHFLRPRPLHFV